MALETAILSEPVTFFDVLAQGRIFRADERVLIESHISAARQHVELATNRCDLHRGRYVTTDLDAVPRFFNPSIESTVAGVTTFTAGRSSLNTLPLARLAILRLAIDSYDSRASSSLATYTQTPTFAAAMHALRIPASAPL
jgi:hypothetical protein